MFNKNELLKDFENEIWLYIDGTLSESRKKYWDARMVTYPELREYFNKTIITLNNYDSISRKTIDDSTYETIILKTTKSKFSLYTVYSKLFSDTNKYDIRKAILASAIVIVVFAVLVLLNKPIEKPVQDREILEWDAASLEKRITNVENSIYLLKHDKSIDKIISNYTKDGWNFARSSIENQIKKIAKEINDKSL